MLPETEMWDEPAAAAEDPDELKPTCKVIPFPKMSFEERVSYDDRAMATRLRYGTEAVA